MYIKYLITMLSSSLTSAFPINHHRKNRIVHIENIKQPVRVKPTSSDKYSFCFYLTLPITFPYYGAKWLCETTCRKK